MDAEQNEKIKIQLGVKQGFILSPMLFHLYSRRIFREALKDLYEGISINVTCINSIRYDDDTDTHNNDIYIHHGKIANTQRQGSRNRRIMWIGGGHSENKSFNSL